VVRLALKDSLLLFVALSAVARTAWRLRGGRQPGGLSLFLWFQNMAPPGGVCRHSRATLRLCCIPAAWATLLLARACGGIRFHLAFAVFAGLTRQNVLAFALARLPYHHYYHPLFAR